jgi:hypothetical protein
MSKIALNKSDIEEITKVLNAHEIQYFNLVYKQNSIGYCIDLEYNTAINGTMCRVIVPVVGVEEW